MVRIWNCLMITVMQQLYASVGDSRHFKKELEKLISAYTQVHEGITAILNYKCLEDGLTYAK